jgi:hypothetical protein
MVGTRRKGRSLTTRMYETEGELNIMGVKYRQGMVRDYWE